MIPWDMVGTWDRWDRAFGYCIYYEHRMELQLLPTMEWQWVATIGVDRWQHLYERRRGR